MASQAFSTHPCSISISIAATSTQVTEAPGSTTVRLKPSQCATAWSRLHAVKHPQTGVHGRSTLPASSNRQHSSIVFAVESAVEVENNEAIELLKDLREAVDHAGGNSEGVDDASLTRFLQGNSLNVEKAAKAFAKHQQWKASFKPQGYISEAEVAGELNAKKSYLQGKDKQGHPLIVILARNHVHNKEDVDEFRRFVVFALDKSIAAASGDGKLIGIIDLRGLGFKNLDSKATIAGFDILQSHYPERIEKLYMINVPPIFNGVWKVVSPFINEVTRQKIEFVNNNKLQETLLSVIEADQLPAEYGGTAEFVLLQDAVVPDWPPAPHSPNSPN